MFVHETIETMYRNLVDVIRHQGKNGQYVREAAKKGSSTRGPISKRGGEGGLGQFYLIRAFFNQQQPQFKIFVQKKKTVLLYTSETCFE